MHRSSWRAARVLRGAKLGQRPPLQQRHHRQSDLDLGSSRAPGLACTCSQRRGGSLIVQSRSYSISPLNGDDATLCSNVVDVKGKGREHTADGPTYDDHQASTAHTSTKPGTMVEDDIYAQNEHNLHSALDGYSKHPIRDSWRNFANLPLDRRKALSESTLAKLAAVHRRGAMASRAKRSTWRRLRDIYGAWEPHVEDAGPVAAGGQQQQGDLSSSQMSGRHIPAQELAATLEIIREWFATQEQFMDRKAVFDAAGLCLVIARRQACYDDPSILANAARHIAQHGNDSRLNRVADILRRHLQQRPSQGHLAGLQESCSLVISELARRMMVRDALELGTLCLEAGAVVSDEAAEQVAQVTEAAKFTPEELAVMAAVLQGHGSLQNNAIYAQWNTILTVRSKLELAVEPDHQPVLAEDRPLVIQQSQIKRLGWLKLQMHQLLSLSNSANNKVRPKGVTMPRAGRRLDAGLRHSAGGQENAVAALHLYTQSLWEGVQPDETLLHLVACAKRRFANTSVFPSGVLRRAARQLVLDEEARMPLNYREKWELPRITHTCSEPTASEAQAGQVLQGASLEQLMHLAVEVQDFELARALSQLLLQRTGSVWRPHERPAMFHKLFDAIVADALLHLRDTKHASAQRVVAFACDLYTHWQRSSGLIPNNSDASGEAQMDRVPRRRPVLSILRLLANNVYSTESFRQTWTALIRDRAVELKEEHIAMYLRAVLEVHRGGYKEDVRAAYQAYEAMRLLHITGKHRYKHLQASVQSIWTGLLHSLRGHEQRQRLRWFGLVHEHLHALRIDVHYGILRDVLHACDGGAVPHDDGSVAELVQSLKEAKVAERLLPSAVLASARSRLADQKDAQSVLRLLLNGQAEAALQATRQVMLLFKQTKSHHQAAIFIDACCAALGGKEGMERQLEELSAMLVDSRRNLGRIGNDLKRAKREAARLDRAPVMAVEKVMQPSLLPITASPDEDPQLAAAALPSGHTLGPAAAMVDTPQVDTTFAKNADHPAEASFLSAFFTHNGGPADMNHEQQAAPAVQARDHQRAALGFRQAAGAVANSADGLPVHNVSEQVHDELDDYGRSYSLASSRSATVQSLPSLPGQAYSTLASQRAFSESFFGPRTTLVATAQKAAPSREYETLPDSRSSTTLSQTSFLQELSQLPQQFADLTMEQVLAWRKRYEAEAQATRQRQELQDAAARRMALSRAHASRWHGWQEVRAVPWY